MFESNCCHYDNKGVMDGPVKIGLKREKGLSVKNKGIREREKEKEENTCGGQRQETRSNGGNVSKE